MLHQSRNATSSHFEVPHHHTARRPSIKTTVRHALGKKQGQLVVCALQTYSQIGGLQNFNKRVFVNLSDRTVARQENSPVVLIRGDEGAVLPALPRTEVVALDNQFRFVWRAVLAGVTRADLFIVGHINLLPLAVLVRCLRPRLPILLFVHGDEVWNSSVGRKRRWYEPIFLRAVTRIASVSAYTAMTMAREFSVARSKFRILPNAVDPTSYSRGLGGQEAPTILTVTRLGSGERRKHVDKMIRAVAELSPKLPNLSYEIVGDGALRPELEALARELGVGDVVKFLGRVDDAGLEAAYARATVFALPSAKEGFGIVYLEAWQHALPVICSSQGASKEIVADGVDGFVVDAADVSMIADRLYRWLSDPGLARTMGENGRCKVEDHYLNKSFRKNLDRIIDELRGDNALV